MAKITKKTLEEAGNFGLLSDQEKQQLVGLPPSMRSDVANWVMFNRRKGNQIDIQSAIKQMQAFAQQQRLRQAVNKGKESKPRQVQSQVQPQQLQNPIQSRLRQAVQKARQRTSQNPAMPSVQQQQVVPVGQIQNRVAYKRFARPVAEGTGVSGMKMINENPAMITSSLRNIINLIASLKPEEIAAIAKMVNSLVSSQAGARQATGMGMRTEAKKIITEAIKVKLIEQVQARNTAEYLLSEGPLTNVWDKIKSAGSSIANQMGFAGQLGQRAQAVGADENAKRAAKELTKVLGKVNQHRQKFNSSILKNSEAMNAYHDLVLNAVEMYQQTQHILGPFGSQIVRQIQDAVGNLVYDLKSEKEQIDTFLKQLKDAGMAKVGGSAMINKQQVSFDPTLLGATAKKKAQNTRAEENPRSVYNKRFMPFYGGKMDPKYGDQLTKSRAFAKAQQGLSSNNVNLVQSAMNDLQKLYAKQIEREKKSKKKRSSSKKK